MKRIFFACTAIICLIDHSVLAQSPSSGQNYIMETTVKSKGHKTASSLSVLPVDSVNRNIQYIDGLGRPLQTVSWQTSPSKKDLVQIMEYDAFGRETKKYLPYAEQTSADGSYKTTSMTNQANYYASPGWDNGAVKTPKPYALTVFEASPLNRVLEQGAPGDTWQPYSAGITNSGHTVKMDYGSNATNEVLMWEITGTGAEATAPYPANRLYKTISRDENWTAGKGGTVEEFKDFEGRVVLKRIWKDESEGNALSTYYIYDDLGNLRYVLPPAVVTGRPITASILETGTVFENFVYAYRYDGRKRLIKKKIPGKGWENMVYNKLGQVVLTQDAKQQIAGEWLYTKYDALGRPVMTGRINSGTKTPAQWQTDIDAQTVLWEGRDDANTGATGTGYTNATLPNVGIATCYTLNYYDDYSFFGNSIGNPSGAYEVNGGRTKGLPTGTKVNILGTTQFLLTVNYYDADGRVIRTKGDNHLSGSDEVINTYSFVGELLSSKRTHSAVIDLVTKGAVIETDYTYDHMGRKVSMKENIDSQGWVTLNKLEYNEIGQLKKKNLHSTDGINFLQNTSLAYNERGWLKNSTSDEFRMQLDYQDGTMPQYNGNIANQKWGSTLSNVFSYGYDKLNRLENGTSTGTVMSEVLTYDVMGNIASLNRDGAGAKTYTYKNGGNQLQSVAGITGTNYVYDANGNATTDGRNGITLGYNVLNLPTTATKTGLSLSYTYSAIGQKLKKVSTTTGTNTTDYAGGIQYTNGNIDFIQTEEGVARKNGTNSNALYIYEYNLSDHLGNVRYTFGTSGNAINKLQTDDYYPFGKRKSSFANANDNKYLYNSKELQDELDGQFDYGARFYDPVIGRWNVVDPLAEGRAEMTPYHYTSNNPINRIDPDGRWDWVKKDNQYLWDDRVVDQETANQYQSGSQYIGQQAEVTPMKTDGTAVGATISLNGDGTITREGVTLNQNSDQIFTNAAGSEFVPRQTVGSHYGLSVNGALFGGFGYGGGVVKDATGKWSTYFTFNGNIGIGGGVGLDIGKNTPTGSNQFYKEDFAGNSGSYNFGVSTPIVDFGYGFGGSLDPHVGGTKAMNPGNFGRNNGGYKTEQIGLSPGTGAGASAMFSYGKTWVY